MGVGKFYFRTITSTPTKLIALPVHMSSPMDICKVYCRSLVVFFPFTVDHYNIVCPSAIYGSCLPLLYLRTFLVHYQLSKRSWIITFFKSEAFISVPSSWHDTWCIWFVGTTSRWPFVRVDFPEKCQAKGRDMHVHITWSN